MAASKESVDGQEHLDALRRRLYRDGAGEEDLRRYAEVRDSLLDAGRPPAEAPAAPTIRRRHPLPVAAIAVAALLVLGVCVGVAVAASPVRPSAVITPTAVADPAPAPTAQPQDIGDGQSLVQDATVITAPATRSVSIDGSEAKAQQFSGTGDAVVPLDVSSVGFAGGRGVVLLSSSEPAPIDWRALTLATRRDRSSYQDVIAQGTVQGGAPAPTPVLFDYPGAPPTRLAIEAPHDLRWTVLVVFLGPTGPSHG